MKNHEFLKMLILRSIGAVSCGHQIWNCGQTGNKEGLKNWVCVHLFFVFLIAGVIHSCSDNRNSSEGNYQNFISAGIVFHPSITSFSPSRLPGLLFEP